MGNFSLIWKRIYVVIYYVEILIKLCLYILSFLNGGFIFMIVFFRMGCYWKVMVDRLWFVIYNMIIEFLMFKN